MTANFRGKDGYVFHWGEVPRVTSVLSMMHSVGLENWKIDQAIDACAKEAGWAVGKGQNPTEVLSSRKPKLRYAYRNTSGNAAGRGTKIHEVAEHLARGETVAEHTLSEEIRPYVEPLRRFVKESNFTPTWIEQIVTNRHYGYAGTCDVIAKVYGREAILDYKTVESEAKAKAWPNHFMQISAYAHCDIRASLAGFELLTPVRDGYLVHVYPGGHHVTHVDEAAIEDHFRAFISLLHVYKWNKKYNTYRRG